MQMGWGLMCCMFQAVAIDQGRGDPGDNVGQGQHLRHHGLLRRQQDRHEPGICLGPLGNFLETFGHVIGKK